MARIWKYLIFRGLWNIYIACNTLPTRGLWTVDHHPDFLFPAAIVSSGRCVMLTHWKCRLMVCHGVSWCVMLTHWKSLMVDVVNSFYQRMADLHGHRKRPGYKQETNQIIQNINYIKPSSDLSFQFRKLKHFSSDQQFYIYISNRFYWWFT